MNKTKFARKLLFSVILLFKANCDADKNCESRSHTHTHTRTRIIMRHKQVEYIQFSFVLAHSLSNVRRDAYIHMRILQTHAYGTQHYVAATLQPCVCCWTVRYGRRSYKLCDYPKTTNRIFLLCSAIDENRKLVIQIVKKTKNEKRKKKCCNLPALSKQNNCLPRDVDLKHINIMLCADVMECVELVFYVL